MKGNASDAGRARARTARTLLWLGVVLLPAALGCGPDKKDGDAGASGSSSSSTTGGGGRTTSLCEILADNEQRCVDPPPDRSQSIAECQTENGPFETRISDCFASTYSSCLEAADCGDDDRCVAEAMLDCDPTVIDSEALAACDAGEEAACQNVATGLLGECLDRFAECEAWDDLCQTLVILAEPYKSEARDCLGVDCAELETCVNAASGQTNE